MASTQELTNYTGPAGVPNSFWKEDVSNAIGTGSDPYLLAAIAKQETNYGSLGAGLEGYALGYGYPAPGQGNPIYKGLNDQLFNAGLDVNSFWGGNPVTYDSLYQFALNVWKPGAVANDPATSQANAKAWTDNVWNIYQGYQKNPALTADTSTYKKITDTATSVKQAVTNPGASLMPGLALFAVGAFGVYAFTRIFVVKEG